ncbi:MAG: right-handed parallel beta-helix repeat-containing protein [Bacteroidia bacterium]|nr:right-handed parallel beta-helix repeat-containing protein [Bacteroidia bacterium]
MDIQSNSNIRIQSGTYTFSDAAKDGVIRIVNKENITIDGDSVQVTGTGFEGFLIFIENSRNVTIKNFKSVKNYYYAVTARQSADLHINDNNFSYNKKDTLGWISIWTDYTAALGGGVLLHQCSGSELHGNTMTQQNDGIALYECDGITINDNILYWNCGFGVRMNFTDNCYIHHNDCSHVNRKTDPSDCAAILLIVSNNNIVEYNNLTYSGDGVFLGQYEYSQIPNNNYFGYNDCSYSPHNAIEATFADGNIYKGNLCNYSNYGFWLGYSFNSLIEDNEIIGNITSGVSVDRGFKNTFKSNLIKGNPYGFELWEGGIIGPYGQQFSHDYWISDNVLEGNMWAISAINTEHLVVKNNAFNYNQKNDIYLEGQSFNDTITGNTFKSPTFWYIQNTSTDPVHAINNTYIPNIDSLIHNKISGDVTYQPYNREPEPKIMMIPPCDMAERPALWTTYCDPGIGLFQPEVLAFDYTDKKVGASSVKLYTPMGQDVSLNYRPGGDSLALWNLTTSDTLTFWVKTFNKSNSFQYYHIRVGNFTGSYYKYTASASLLDNAKNVWKKYRIPLKGNTTYVKSEVGHMDLSQTNYVEFHADTWGSGFTIWLDGVQFKTCNPMGIDDSPAETTFKSGSYPNPFATAATIWFDLPESGRVSLSVYDLNGQCLATLLNREMPAGRHETEFSRGNLVPGIYFYRLQTRNKSVSGKLVVGRF